MAEVWSGAGGDYEEVMMVREGEEEGREGVRCSRIGGGGLV